MARNTHLKIKVKTLAAESRFIRQEELKHRNAARKARSKERWQVARRLETAHWWLYTHRIHTVQPAARTNLLAYGFLRGRSYAEMEAKARVEPNWKEIRKIVERFDGNTADFETWLRFAKAHFRRNQVGVEEAA